MLEKIKANRREDKMVEKQVEVKLKTGLQARPAALFVQEATAFIGCFSRKGRKKSECKKYYGINEPCHKFWCVSQLL